MENNEINNAKNFDELLDFKYGKVGTKERDDFEERAQYFVISEMQKEARKKKDFSRNQKTIAKQTTRRKQRAYSAH